ncbi:MAG TPA: hypothetical protein VGC47_05860 [Acidimicrobiia bacterium]|jgi:hypothetical protein
MTPPRRLAAVTSQPGVGEDGRDDAAVEEPSVRESVLTLRRLWLGVPFIVLAWSATRVFTDNSFLWHVRAGTVQLDAGEVLRSDPFSLTHSGEPWRTQSWLAELGYGALERAAGGIGWAPWVVFSSMACAVALVGITMRRRRSGHGGMVVGMLLVAWMTVPFSFPRPAALAFPLMALVVLASDRARPQWWALPPILWLWACVHGSFVIGLGFIALVAVQRRSGRAAVALGLSAIGVSLTAHGLALWGIIVDFATNREALDLIEEWQRPSLTDHRTWPFFIVVTLVVIGLARRDVESRDLWVIVPFAAFGMTAVRNLMPAVIVLAPFAAAAVPSRAGRATSESRVLNVAVAGALFFIVALGLFRPVGLSPTVFPTRDAIAALGAGPAFHGIGEGGLLIYQEWPGRRVLIDDRAELYGAGEMRAVLEAQAGRGWEALFARYGLNQAIVAVDSRLEHALVEAYWLAAYRDDHFAVYEAPS